MTYPEKTLIYIVNDDEQYTDILKRAFTEQFPISKMEFFSGGQALMERLNEDWSFHPDLIILDLSMPEPDCLGTLKQIRLNSLLKLIPVIILAPIFAPGNINLCYESGANSCLAKPSKFEDVKRLVDITCQFWFEIAHKPPKSGMSLL